MFLLKNMISFHFSNFLQEAFLKLTSLHAHTQQQASKKQDKSTW